jgi:hypothetical protein
MIGEPSETAMLRALDLALERVNKIAVDFLENPDKFINGWRTLSGKKVGGIFDMPPSMLGDKTDAQRVGMSNGYVTALGDITKVLEELRTEIEQGAHP